MAAKYDPLVYVQDVLEEIGYGEFQVKKLELSPKPQPTSKVNPKVEQIVQKIVKRLETKGHGTFYLKTLDIGLNLSIQNCPPGSEPQNVREELPDGTIRWSIKCVKK